MGLTLTHATCASRNRLDGKIAVVTGANTGIGKVTACDFYLRGARVVMACRDAKRCRAALEDIERAAADPATPPPRVGRYAPPDGPVGSLEVAELDLSDLASVRACAADLTARLPRIDLLVNNAGVMMCPLARTPQDLEMQIGTNHFGHYLFTMLLLPLVRRAPAARIVNVSSLAAERGTMNFDDLHWRTRSYSAMDAYQQSKLANVLFTRELATRLKANNITNVTTYSLHPGVIRTELARHLDDVYFKGARILLTAMFRVFSKTPLQGSQTSIYCAVADEAAHESGLHYAECAHRDPGARGKNDADARRLWEESARTCGLDAAQDLPAAS